MTRGWRRSQVMPLVMLAFYPLAPPRFKLHSAHDAYRLLSSSVPWFAREVRWPTCALSGRSGVSVKLRPHSWHFHASLLRMRWRVGSNALPRALGLSWWAGQRESLLTLPQTMQVLSGKAILLRLRRTTSSGAARPHKLFSDQLVELWVKTGTSASFVPFVPSPRHVYGGV